MLRCCDLEILQISCEVRNGSLRQECTSQFVSSSKTTNQSQEVNFSLLLKAGVYIIAISCINYIVLCYTTPFLLLYKCITLLAILHQEYRPRTSLIDFKSSRVYTQTRLALGMPILHVVILPMLPISPDITVVEQG